MSYKLSAIASKARIEAALDAQAEAFDWDESVTLAAFETAPDAPDVWQLDAYLAAEPTAEQREAVRALFGDDPPELTAEELPETDWVTESQRGAEPIRAGRFYVHTPEHAPSDEEGVTSFCIPAAQAFGTGHHETTAGCLEMLDTMHGQGLAPRSIADIGTGTGLLAFAALTLWPRAVVTSSDIDPVCEPAVIENARRNGITIGNGPGMCSMVVADGMDDASLQTAAPFDLLIANILAGPLIEMAEDFTGATAKTGDILLSGLLATQMADVETAYASHGFHRREAITKGDWAILWLTRQ